VWGQLTEDDTIDIPTRQGLPVWPTTIADPLFTSLSLWLSVLAVEPTRARSLPLAYSRTRKGTFWDPLLTTQTESAEVQLEAVNGKDSGAWREEVVVVEMAGKAPLGPDFLPKPG
jgi:hypothetical protein